MYDLVITGAAGFIGYHLAEQLTRDGNKRALLLDNFSVGARCEMFAALVARPNVTFAEETISTGFSASGITENTLIYHMAAMNGTQRFYESPLAVFNAAMLSTCGIVDECIRTGAKLVFAGTSESYASTVTAFDWPVPTSETVPLSIDDPSNPRWSYGGAKIACEVLIHAAQREKGLAASIVRFHNVYGPRMGFKHVIPDFLQRAQKGVYELYGHEDTRSFIYIDDAVSALSTLAAHVSADSVFTVNVGSEQEITMKDLAERMMQVLQVPVQSLILHEGPIGSVRRRCPDISRLRGLGWQERISLREGLDKTIQWYMAAGNS